MKRAFSFLLCCFWCFFLTKALAQQNPNKLVGKPRLVIGIVVDHMRTDYIFRYWDKLSEGGFKRLVNYGTFCKNAQYDYLYSQAGVDHASIFTGTSPSYHGIISQNWFNRLSERVESAIRDENTYTVGGSSEEGRMSARKLLTRTLGDEMKLVNQQSKVIGIGLDAGSAILSAGHAADEVYWMEDASGHFITSSYYQDTLYNWVQDFNLQRYADSCLAQAWTPLNGGEKLSFPNKLLGKIGWSKEFFYDVKREKKRSGSYGILKEIPFGNMLIRDFAIATIVNENLGKDENTDLLTITLSCLDYKERELSPFSPEAEDSFIRLDRELEIFLNFLNEQVGIENALVFLTASQVPTYSPDDLESQNIPAGYFNPYNAVALLKSYFNVTFGPGNWISHYDSKQIYFNHQLIENSKLSLQEMQNTASRFLAQLSGVATTVTAHSLLTTSFTHGVREKIQQSYYQKRSGDILIALEQGWIIKNEHNFTSLYSTITVPLFWYGWKINHSTISRPLGIANVVPTIANFLNITTSAECEGEPIEELMH